MKVKDCMVTKLLTVSEDDSLALAGHKMAWGGMRHLPVVRGDQVVGVVAERDLLVWRAERGTWDQPEDRVRAVMSSPAEVTVPDEELSRAAAQMLGRKIGCLPVVLQGRLVGMITSTDLVGHHVARGYAGETTTDGTTARDFMTEWVYSAKPEDSLLEAVDLMTAKRIRHLPVVDRQGHLLGMLSERDLRSLLGKPADALLVWPLHPIGNRTVSDVMNRKVISVSAAQPWIEVVSTMVGHNVGALPVVGRGGQLVGMISYVDLLREATRRLSDHSLTSG
jgi:CBS domain-containing protein